MENECEIDRPEATADGANAEQDPNYINNITVEGDSEEYESEDGEDEGEDHQIGEQSEKNDEQGGEPSQEVSFLAGEHPENLNSFRELGRSQGSPNASINVPRAE